MYRLLAHLKFKILYNVLIIRFYVKDVLFEQLVRAARPHFIFGILTKMFMHQKERHYFINWELSEAESENGIFIFYAYQPKLAV